LIENLTFVPRLRYLRTKCQLLKQAACVIAVTYGQFEFCWHWQCSI